MALASGLDSSGHCGRDMEQMGVFLIPLVAENLR